MTEELKTQIEIPDGWGKDNFSKTILPVKIDRLKQVQANAYKVDGKYPIVDQGQKLIAGWTNDETTLLKDDLPLIVFGDHTRIFKYIDFPFAVGADGTKLLKPKDKFNPRYFYYQLLDLDIPSKGYSRHYKLLKEKYIFYPELPEQKRIAAVLFKIQKAIEVQESIIKTTQELKKSTMQHLFTYGLRGEKTKETEIGRMPESWKIATIGSFANIIMGQSPKGHHYNKDRIGMPLLNGPAEFTAKYPIPVQWTTSPTKIANHRDILFCVRENTVARMNIANQDYCIGRGLAAIRGINGVSTTEFLYYIIQYYSDKIYIYATAGGSTFPNFSKTDFNQCYAQKPDIREQIKIAHILLTIDKKIDLHTAKKSDLQDLFKTMLNGLMTGDIRVKGLDIDVLEVGG